MSKWCARLEREVTVVDRYNGNKAFFICFNLPVVPSSLPNFINEAHDKCIARAMDSL